MMQRFLMILVFGLLLSGNAYAECIEGDCENGQGTYMSKSGTKYVGEFKNGEEHGQGTLTFKKKGVPTRLAKYVGEFKNGKLHGQGTITYESGSTYTGSWVKNIKNGYGTYVSGKDGHTYEGYYKKNKRHGEGKITHKDGSTFIVYYKKGKLKSKEETEKSKVKKEVKTEQLKLETMIDKAKDTCESLGFEEGTEKFADCGLKLYTQSVELAAKSKQQIVMMPQSSGSNTMTIYDPVRDNRALINQGMKMLGGCSFGNC